MNEQLDQKINFTHLHVHTEYSLLDGSAKIKELVARTKELGMDSIAITDHGVMFGVIDFYKAAKAEGIKPILGCEVYVASGSRFDKESKPGNFYYHLVLLAENMQGYHNLIKLVSRGFTEGFYYKPRIDIELLKEYKDGLICLSACLAGPVAKNVLNVSYERALKEALLYKEIFGEDHFFLELQDHGYEKQHTVNEAILRIHEETGLKLVCTNDTHYIYEADAKAHEVLLCIQTGKTMLDEDHMVYEGEQFFVKSPAQMYELFKHVPEALENTYQIAQRCNIDIQFNEYKLPKFDVPDNKEAFDYLKELCYDGLQMRYGEITPEMEERLLYELSVIHSMGFVDYFLITWDFIKYAIDNQIPVGPGRGSATGCIVAYSLRITNIDPLKYNLIFERFLNPERVSMPDIDIDFCYERRQEVIDYVVKKYGEDHVAQIATFGTMAAKGAIRDVGRALGMAYGDVDKIAKMIPFGIGMTIDLALEMNPELKAVYNEEEEAKYLIDMAKRLEGLPRHSSTHAAGVVISNEPVDEYVPLNQNDGVITTQFPMTTLEELGLLKMDFLGLRTLTVIQHTVDEVKRRYGVEIDLDNLEMKDQKVFDMISQAKTEGVFQLESSGMKSFMKELRPTSIDDWTAGIALYRPGPMDFIPKYVKGKNTTGPTQYTHPALEPILKETYGCIVYQEQVMQIVRDLGGYSLGRSDMVRRAMSKKKTDVMARERKNFVYGLGDEVPGCIKNGIPKEAAEKIFDEMTDFAKYAFNKSHAVAYAVVGYQTAWLKTHYPTEFMAALMTSVMDVSGKIAEYINECKKMGVTVRPPDINEGFGHFTVSDIEDKSVIRFGLNAIKNVGRPTVAAITAERKKAGKFKSLSEFINRMESGDINKRCIESLIKAGAFDSLGGARSQYRGIFEKLISGTSNTRKRNIEGQMSLFEITIQEDTTDIYTDELPDIEEYAMNQILADEKEVLGIYVSGHPVSEYEDEMKKYITATSLDFMAKDNENGDEVIEQDSAENPLYDGQSVTVGGIITYKSVKYTRNNNAMAFVTLEDFYGSIEAIVFPNIYEKYSKLLTDGKAVIIKGKVSVREDQANTVITNEIKFLEKNSEKTLPNETLWLKIPREKTTPYNDIMLVLTRFRGSTPVVVYDEKSGQKMKVTDKYWVNASNDSLIISLKKMLGEKSVVVK